MASTPIVEMDEGIYFVGDTKRFRTYDEDEAQGAQKDGALWSGITSALLYLVDPSGNVSSPITGSQEAPGIWYADLNTSHLDEDGEWHRYWKLSDGTITLTWGRVVFSVREIG